MIKDATVNLAIGGIARSSAGMVSTVVRADRIRMLLRNHPIPQPDRLLKMAASSRGPDSSEPRSEIVEANILYHSLLELASPKEVLGNLPKMAINAM